MRLTDITCCGLEYAMGIDCMPSFSWNTVGFHSVGYCIKIIDHETNECVYDTGICSTQQTHNVEVSFQGKPRTVYRAEIASYIDAESTVTGGCFFETGFIDAKEFQVPWITADGQTAPVFHRKFIVDQNATGGRLYVCALGYGDVFLNGQRIKEEYFTPAWSDYHYRDMSKMLYPINDAFSYSAYYITYDITDSLVPGENELQITLGNGFYHQNKRNVEGNLDYGIPKLFVRMDWEDVGGQHTICGDQDFYWTESAYLENNVYFGETYDARTANNKGQEKHAVSLVSAPETVMRSQLAPADKAFEEFIPALVKKEENRTIWDMGVNLSGVVQITTSIPKGQEIQLRYSEELTPEQELDFHSAGHADQIQTDKYISNGNDRQVWSARFTWHGFRYVEVTGAVDEVRGIFIHADVKSTGSFVCSDDTLNWITETYMRTQLCNLHGGVPSDCPHRERLGYTGDGQLTADTALLFWDTDSFYRKWYQDILDGQCRKTGHVQHTAPFYGGGGGPGLWGGAIVFLPYKLYRYNGDKNFIRKNLNAMERYIIFCREHCVDGLLTSELEGGWCLGDWCFSKDTQGPSESFVNTYCLIQMLDQFSFMAREVGENDKAICYERYAQEHREAFHRAFYHQEDGTYDRGICGAGAFALALGFTDALSAVVEYYESRGKLDTGIAATPVLLEQLSKHGHIDLAIQLLTVKEYPSFSYMRAHGATTLWEEWEGTESHNHPMFGSVAGFFMRNIVGLNPENASPGFDTFKICPQIPKSLDWASGDITTPYGKVSVKWRKGKNNIVFECKVPENLNTALCWEDQCIPLHSKLQILCFLRNE